MKHLKTYKIYESDNVCNTCNGTGEVDKEINMWGEIGKVECDDCNGTGKLSNQLFTKDLTSFTDESESELKSLLDKYKIRYGVVLSDVERYSDEHEDVEKIEIKAQIYSKSALSKEFLEEVNKIYIDYDIYFDTYNHLYLTVYKLY
jgi:DnaJ-class molecular chaperone